MEQHGISGREFGTLPDGRVVHEYTLVAGGLVLSLITLGGIVTTLWAPDRDGVAANVVRGFDNLADYATRNPHFGVIVGRYGNRIAGARFTLDGQLHELARNDGPNCLHGGPGGFGKRLWLAEPVAAGAEGAVALRLRYTSEDGEEGFPGRLQVLVRYTLGPGPSWRVDYEARTDRATVVNLTYHDYFNLAGSGSALAHELSIAASRYCPVDQHLIPLGVADVVQTPFDFRMPTSVEARLRDAHPQLVHARGYDHNWLLDGAGEEGLHFAARLRHPASGRTMDVHTTEPALQFYSGKFLDGSLAGTGDRLLRQGDGLCLETQHSPDSPNRPDWPGTVLRPDGVYRSSTEHRFGVDVARI